MKQLLTVDEASEFTRLSTKTLYPFAKKKKIPPVRLRGRVFFTVEGPISTLGPYGQARRSIADK